MNSGSALLLPLVVLAACRSSQLAAPAGGSTAAVQGIDRAAMDLAVAPGDDFCAYANGTWQTT
jgi:putative endopeptidase